MGSGAVWEAGFYPFLPGDALKILIAMVLLPLGWAVRAHHYNRYRHFYCFISNRCATYKPTKPVVPRAHSSTSGFRFQGLMLFLKDQFTIPEQLAPVVVHLRPNCGAAILTQRFCLQTKRAAIAVRRLWAKAKALRA